MVADRHTTIDYAVVPKDLSDTHFPDAKSIILVQDNLNTHVKASLYQAYPAAESRRLVEASNGATRPSTARGSISPNPISPSRPRSASTGASVTNKR